MIKEGVKLAKALSNPTRWKILQNSNGKLDVSELATLLGQTEANISAQIKILEKAGLVMGVHEPGVHGIRKRMYRLQDKITIYLI